MENSKMKYYIQTHTQFSHNHVIALLSSRDIQYRYELTHSEETYSLFEVVSLKENFDWLREVSKENDGSSFTLEYGTY